MPASVRREARRDGEAVSSPTRVRVNGRADLAMNLLSPILSHFTTTGGDKVSTWVAKPEVHAEVQFPRKTDCKLIVANDDNYALAAYNPVGCLLTEAGPVRSGSRSHISQDRDEARPGPIL